MDNNQLLAELNEINKIDNELDRLEKLIQFKSTYKKSSFYKKTKMPLQKLMQWLAQTKIEKVSYHFADLFDGTTLADKISDIIENIDSSALEDFFNKLTYTFDPTTLQEQQGELQELIHKIDIK